MVSSDLEEHFRAMEGLNNPYERVQIGLESLLKSMNFDIETKSNILSKIPKRWERYGDLILFPKNTFFNNKELETFFPEFWEVVARGLRVTRLGIQGEIKGDYRETGAFLVLGENANVRHIENKIIYSFDATKCMFSSGNVSERIRVSELDCKDEVILDLYAGIGYYTLPLLVHTGCKHVHSCEWNKVASESLLQNLVLNNVNERCTVHFGDNSLTLQSSELIGNIDRVFLGLLPSSRDGWKLALKALKNRGGVIHLHGNSPGKKELEWANEVITQLSLISKEIGKNWRISLIHLEKVKWYSPHVRHVVLDLLVERDE